MESKKSGNQFKLVVLEPGKAGVMVGVAVGSKSRVFASRLQVFLCGIVSYLIFDNKVYCLFLL